MKPDFSTLNTAFQSAGVNGIEFSEGIYTRGVGMYAISDNFIMGGFMYNGAGVVESDSLSVKGEYDGKFFELGIGLIRAKILSIYGLLGTGASGVKLKIRPILGDMDFNEVILHPAQTSIIKTGGIAVEPAIVLQISLSRKKGQNISLFIKASYIYLPQKADWVFDDGREVLQGPDFRPGGITISSGIFFGGAGK